MIEILYTCWNRLEFTRASFELLRRNTDWSKVSRLVVYDDLSEDGTAQWIANAGFDIPVEGFEVRHGGWHSLGATMNDFISRTEAEQFVKIDNDIALPPGWLEVLLTVADRNPDYDLIGMEAGWTGRQEPRLPAKKYKVTGAQHIGGVGFMRAQAFVSRVPIPLSLGKHGRDGFTIWQHKHEPHAGWITPDLEVVQFDRIPVDPWKSLTLDYINKGWARGNAPYTHDMHGWWDWLPKDLHKRRHLA